MSISFNLMPINVRVPGQYIEIDNTKAFQGLSGYPSKVLLIGQKIATGAQDPLEPVQVTRADQAAQLFGSGAQITHMIEKFLEVNSFTPLIAIAQNDEGASVAATGAVKFGGPSTAAGTLNLYIGGRRVRMLVQSGATAVSLATALAATITADETLAVTAAVDGADTTKVNLTARNKGEASNDLDCRVNYYADEETPAGITVTITAFSGGSGNPDISDVIDAIGDEWYTDIIMPYTDTSNLNAMEAELESRFGPLKMIDGHLYTGLSGTNAELVTKGQSRNGPHHSMIGAKASPTPPYEWAAVLGGVCSYYLKNDPARPLQTLAMPGVLPPAISDRFTFEERNLLLNNGVSTFRIGDDGQVYVERIITTYRENPFGAADPSYLDITTLKTLSFLRYDLRNFIALQYPRYKLADDGTRFARGQAVVTPKVIRASIIDRFRLWEDSGLVENIDQFKQDLIVERDKNDPNRVNALVPPDIVNGFRVFAGLVQFRL